MSHNLAFKWLARHGLGYVKSQTEGCVHIERLGLDEKFSREFERKDRGNWEFTLTKLRNSLENFSRTPKVSSPDMSPSHDFTYL